MEKKETLLSTLLSSSVNIVNEVGVLFKERFELRIKSDKEFRRIVAQAMDELIKTIQSSDITKEERDARWKEFCALAKLSFLYLAIDKIFILLLVGLLSFAAFETLKLLLKNNNPDVIH